MKKLILALVVVSFVFLSLKATVYADVTEKIEDIVVYGEMFGGAEACGVLKKRAAAIALVINAVDKAYTEKTDRMLANYAFTLSAIQTYQKVKDGTFNKNCNEIDLILEKMSKN